MKKRVIVAAALAGIVLTAGRPAAAQDVAAIDRASLDKEVRLFRKDVKSLKKQIISANLDLTETEAAQFWPIYDRYTKEMARILDKKFETIKEYVTNHNTITDEQADAYIQGRAAAEESILQLRLKYVPIFREVLSGKTAALFTQMDWRLDLMVELQVAAQVPMIEP